jgi:hypothetical protein
MLMQNKFKPESVIADVNIDLPQVAALQRGGGEDTQARRKQVWEVIVRMHYLSHELCDPELGAGVSPAFTKLVGGILSEWAVMAEQAMGAAEPVQGRSVRLDHH